MRLPTTKPSRTTLLHLLPVLINTAVVTALNSNPHESPQNLHEISDVCSNRSSLCEVLLDVPPTCVDIDGTSTCPIVFFLHGAGGTNDGYVKNSGVHSVDMIGVYPQGESCPKPGWNTGPKECNQCEWSDYECTSDPNEGLFVELIIDELRSEGAKGNLYAVGSSNGAALAHRLGVNLPFKGIVTKVTQLLASPERSGPGLLNYNQPRSDTGLVSVLSIMGTDDNLIPYEGGPSGVFSGESAFQLMGVEESMLTWAANDGCGTTPVVTSVSSSVGTGTADFEKYPCPSGVILENYKVYGGDHGTTGGAKLGSFEMDDLEYDFIRRVEADGSFSPVASPVASPVESPVASPVSPPQNCVNDASWHGKKSTEHDCDHVGEDPDNRCHWFSADNVKAKVACPETCDPDCQFSNPSPVATLAPTGPSPTPPLLCEDSATWAGKMNPTHNCAYVGEKPEFRCSWEDSEGVFAKIACAKSCGTCDEEASS